MKMKKMGWILLLVAVAVAVVYYFATRKKSNATAIPSTTTPSGTSSTNTVSSGYPLKLGSKGDKVKQLQIVLNEYWSKNLFFDVPEISTDYEAPRKVLTVDGIWGNDTEAMYRYIALGQGAFTETMANEIL